jgi:Uma2 family endonuclease
MPEPYEEILEGASLPRSAPGERHEQICRRVHGKMTASLTGLTIASLLAPRTKVQVLRTTLICPDLAILTTATQKLFLAVEIISREDHQSDTVLKKDLYEKIRIPRLWIIDPRYDNVEIYHSNQFGLSLQGILAGREVLREKLIPQFEMTVLEVFGLDPAPSSS